MKTNQAKRSTMKTEAKSNQENVQNSRSAFKMLQRTTNENQILTGSIANTKNKPIVKIPQMHKSTQTEQNSTDIEDLTAEEPSPGYWKRVAEKRQEFIDECLEENDKLNESVKALKEENKICKDMLDESRNLVEILKEMFNESESEENETADHQADE